ncbi:MAG: LytTR family transcriptional regulator [Winogradskyella sp.]|jgi:tetratricopeptide (TPR) repeat protein|uniref:LytTR family transcriptional regulator DNA-binding domain-containing protein n=1 Tax=Xanthomarina gelatinilytica TaxID=1137281 RepID=UPI001DE49B79|nr:LytTR family transcriptional regulator [Winogradskyella sp.]
MKKSFIAIVIFITTAYGSFSQSFQDLNTEQLQKLCQKHIRNSDSLLLYAEQFLDLATKNNEIHAKIEAHRFMGSALSRKQSLNESNEHLYQAIKLLSNTGSQNVKNSIYTNLANNHKNSGQYDSAHFYINHLLKDPKNIDDHFFKNSNYYNLATLFFLESNLDSTQFYLSKSIKGFENDNIENPNKKRFLAQSYSLLAEVFYQKQDYKRSLELATRGLELTEQINFRPALERTYNLIARNHEKLGNLDKSQEYHSLEDRHTSPMPKGAFEHGFGQKHNKIAGQESRKKILRLNKEKSFYRTNLFVTICIISVLVLVTLLLYKRHKGQKIEVEKLQNELDTYNNKVETKSIPLKLLLKSKATIDITTVLFIKSDGHYVEIYLQNKDNPEIERISLTKMLNQLPKQDFIRIHKSYIVNIHKIKIINSTQVMLENGEWLKLSRTYKQDLKDLLHKP